MSQLIEPGSASETDMASETDVESETDIASETDVDSETEVETKANTGRGLQLQPKPKLATFSADYTTWVNLMHQRQNGTLACTHQPRTCDDCFDVMMDQQLMAIMCPNCELWSDGVCPTCYDHSGVYIALRCQNQDDVSMDEVRCGKCGFHADGCCGQAPRFARCACSRFHENSTSCYTPSSFMLFPPT
jgi:hypothetical protein